MVEDKGTDDEQQRAKEAPPAGALPHKNPTRSDERAAKRDYASCREWARIVMEFIALIALIYYAHQARLQANAARDGVNAARSAVEETHSALVLSQLPIVTIVSVTPDKDAGLVDQGHSPLTFRIANLGKGPALGLSIDLGWVIGGPTYHECAPPFDLIVARTIPAEYPIPESPLQFPTLAPGDEQSRGIRGVQLSKGEADLVRSGDWTFYFFTRLTYRDSLKHPIEEIKAFEYRPIRHGRIRPDFTPCPGLGTRTLGPDE